ncbi:MAG: DNA polymerase III subunit delta' [Pelotomaculum sp.]|uniref:DNA polymerase III subunit delta' n=1 Tax=Pelotomaculum thermopropionicum (strain DSM 13744 / JCM 10971 / SI) TaxID=370438 RepID=A5D691_PELTS|nr:DNA polymerase III subunit delta' [Pelotomaculum sp.]BAF58244.1 DNA polymerase III, gamma/tau subunits [Pelotomaculum thermopropionicum SI]
MLFLREIVGHRQITGALMNAVACGRVAHAYLFAGPAGVGKKTTALAFARALLCPVPEGGDACGTCRQCRQVEHRNHPDLYIVNPSGATIKIEQIRELQHRAPYRPYQGGRKLFLICRAETMTAEAANCLLKTLEEPPHDTVLILVSDQPQSLLPTVLSRCQQCFFKSIPLSELSGSLTARHGLAQEEALLAAAMSGGSMGKALAYASGSLAERRNAAGALAGALKTAGPLEALEMAGKISEDREEALLILEMLICWFRDLLVYRETEDAALLFNADRAGLVKKEAQSFQPGRLVEIIEDIEATRNKIEANASTRLALEALFLRLSGGACAQEAPP